MDRRAISMIMTLGKIIFIITTVKYVEAHTTENKSKIRIQNYPAISNFSQSIDNVNYIECLNAL